jgi:signal transduction histidine kinase
LKHANATTVRVDLGCDSTNLSLSIQDDGRGFDTEQPHYGMGLPGMHERVAHFGGQLEIKVRPGDGTEVRVTIPLSRAIAKGQA